MINFVKTFKQFKSVVKIVLFIYQINSLLILLFFRKSIYLLFKALLNKNSPNLKDIKLLHLTCNTFFNLFIPNKNNTFQKILKIILRAKYPYFKAIYYPFGTLQSNLLNQCLASLPHSNGLLNHILSTIFLPFCS